MKTQLKIISLLGYFIILACSKKESVAPQTNTPVTNSPNANIPSGWKVLSNFTGSQSLAGVSVAMAGKIYAGLGYTGVSGYNTVSNKWFEYDPTTDKWTEKASFPGVGRANAVAFGINGKIYVGLGTNYNRSTKNEVYGDFYEYDPAANTWATKATFIGPGRDQPAYFTLNEKGYVCTGNTDPMFSITVTRDLYQYDPSIDTWTKKADMPAKARCRAMGFAAGGLGYVCGGEDNNSILLNDQQSYDPTTNTWKVARSFPINLSRGKAISAGTKAYMLGGINGPTAANTIETKSYQYDALTDTWAELADLPSDDTRDKGRFYSMGEIINGKLYFGAGAYWLGDRPNLKSDFFEYSLK
jgi:N-acetylneuraminic acid mutarotase